MTVRWVPLGELVEIDRVPIEIALDTEYRRIGIYSWGKGHFYRHPVTNADMGKMRYFTFPAPSLVFSNIQAWEGAVAFVEQLESNAVCSSRFYPYVPRKGTDVSLRYLFEFFRGSIGQEIMRCASPGTQVRNKLLSRSAIERARVPVPSRAEQDRIVSYLDSIERVTAGYLDSKDTAALIAHAGAEESWLQRFKFVPLSKLVEVGPSPERVPPQEEVAFVPMSALSAETGAIVGAQYMQRSGVSAGYRQFARGDIVFARITPSMQNGKSAIFNDPRARVGYGSTEFHVMRPNDMGDANWIWGVLRTRWFRELAAKSFTGTAGQQRVPASFLRKVEIPLPNRDAIESATTRLLASQSTLAELLQVDRRTRALRAAVLPAARNEIFASMV